MPFPKVPRTPITATRQRPHAQVHELAEHDTGKSLSLRNKEEKNRLLKATLSAHYDKWKGGGGNVREKGHTAMHLRVECALRNE